MRTSKLPDSYQISYIVFFTILAICGAMDRKGESGLFIATVGVVSFAGWWLLAFGANTLSERMSRKPNVLRESEVDECRRLIWLLERDKHTIKGLSAEHPLEVTYPEGRFVFRNPQHVDVVLLELRAKLLGHGETK